MIMRTGKPCSMGSGSPFIPMASNGSRSASPSRGVLQVHPSTDVLKSWSAPGSMPARSSRGRSGVPSQRAVPMRSPPIGLETHMMVMSRSIMGISSSSA